MRLQRRSSFLVLMGLLALPITPAFAADAITGVTTVGPPGVRMTVADLMARQAVAPIRKVEPEDKEAKEKQPDRSQLPQNPFSPLASAWPDLPAAGARAGDDVGAFSPQTVGTTFTGATLSGVNPTFSFPPDCMGAVGPSQYVVFVNGRLVTFNKATGVADGVLNVDPDVFFSPVINGSSTSDPRIRYDRLTGRWFLVIINVSTPNRILFAVSDAASANAITAGTVFTFFFIDIAATPPAISNTCLADYPTLGIDASALYIGTNNFCGAPQTYNSSDGYVVRKSSILGAGPMVLTTFRGLVASVSSDGPYTPQGVDNLDPAATEGYFIGVDAQAFGLLQLRRVSNPGGAPTISANIPITTPATAFPLPVPHLGNTGGNNGRLSALDDRLFAAHIRNGRLWTAHNIGVNNTGVSAGTVTRNGSRWYEINVPPVSGSPTLTQSGTVFTASGTNLTDQRSYWIPSIMVSGQGHAALGFSVAGSAERANAATVGRLATDAGGTMQTPVLFSASATAYNPPSDPGGANGRRWGDYSYTSLDPLDDMTMWTVQEFCNASNSYGVRVAKLIAPPPATPNAVADVTAGQNPVNVTLTGLSVSGSGFYDPGANLPGVPTFNHLAVSITNGAATGTPPSVISATYVNPTTVNLVLNASAATASIGAERYTVTVTNPDGQTAAAAILRVVAGGPPSVSIAAGPSVSEGNSGTTAYNFTVNLSALAAGPVQVNYQTSDGTATVADNDYVPATNSITIPAGQPSGVITINGNGDAKFEGNETFTVTLTGATGATLGTPVAATGTIQNDDVAPAVSINDVTLAEGNSGSATMSFTVSLASASGLPASVSFATANGTATIADGDFVANSGTLNFPAGTVSLPVSVQIQGDTKFEADEVFTVGLSVLSDATAGDMSGTGTITNDDAAPVVTIATGPSVNEGNAGSAPANVTVSLSQISGLPVTVNYATADGSATTADNDYTGSTSSIVIAAGQPSGTIAVSVLGDPKFESDETFSVTLTSATGGTLGGTVNSTATILNDDAQPLLSVTSVSQPEGNAGSASFGFVATLSAASGLPVTADYATADGSATLADGDYVAATGSLTFAPGETSKPIPVTVNGDPTFESDETFVVNVTNLAGAGSGTLPGTGTIQNDDAAPTLSIDDVTLAEGNAGAVNATFTVSLSHASSQTVTVTASTADGSATVANNDYAAGSAPLSIAPGSLTATFAVGVNGDVCGEPNETFTVTLSAPGNATIADGSGTGTIQNDDNTTAPTVTVSVPNGGETAQTGTALNIQWTAADDIAVSSVDILLSRDNGATFAEILASDVPNTGAFAWTVTGPATPTPAARVRVVAKDANCNQTADASDAAFHITDPTTAVPTSGPVTAFALARVQPNPTPGACRIDFDLPREARVHLAVVDLQGREVAVLASRTFPAGRWQAAWNGQTSRGPAATGVYFVRYQVAGRSFSRRLVLAR